MYILLRVYECFYSKTNNIFQWACHIGFFSNTVLDIIAIWKHFVTDVIKTTLHRISPCFVCPVKSRIDHVISNTCVWYKSISDYIYDHYSISRTLTKHLRLYFRLTMWASVLLLIIISVPSQGSRKGKLLNIFHTKM